MRRSSKVTDKSKSGSCPPKNSPIISCNLFDNLSRVHKERDKELNTNVLSVQPQLSAALPFIPSCLDDFSEPKSDTSFPAIGQSIDSVRKYSINRFKFSDEIHDEIIKHMKRADSDMHIKEITKVGRDQFLTYQILIKTNDSIYFIKPKDRKCFLLNKNSVSEMVAPKIAVNSNGDKINTAKFAYVELESGSASNSNQSSVSRSCGYTNGSQNCFSSTETEPYNRCLHDYISPSESDLTNTTESQSQWSDGQRKRRDSDVSKALSRSSKTVTHHLERMSVGTCNRPYHFCNIVFYSTISAHNSDSVLQNKYFAFVKNKIKDKLYNLPNQTQKKKRDLNEQVPEKKNVCLTAEYVDHFWEKNKLEDCRRMFNLEPEFYSRMFSLRLSEKSMIELGLDPKKNADLSSRFSSILSRPSKHDSLLTSFLDLKLRDIMSLIWNSSSKSKLSGNNSSQCDSEKDKKGPRQNVQKSKKGKETHGDLVSQQDLQQLTLRQLCAEKIEGDKNAEISLADQGNYMIRMKRKSSHEVLSTNKSADGEESKLTSSSAELQLTNESLNLNVSKSPQRRLNSENLKLSSMYSSGVKDITKDRACANDSLNNLVLLHDKTENENMNCVLALTSSHDPLPRTTDVEDKKCVKEQEALNIVQKSNMELHTLISSMELTQSTDIIKDDTNNCGSATSGTLNQKCDNGNFKSQATLSISSNSCVEVQKSIKVKSKIEWSFHAEPIYSNVWKKQQIAQDNMLERVIPEDSILSISTGSNNSFLHVESPTHESRLSCVQNESNLRKDCYSQSEDDMLKSCCNLSVLAMVPSKRVLHSDTCRFDGLKHSCGKRAGKSPREPPCDRKRRIMSRQTVSSKSRSTGSRFCPNEVAIVRALPENDDENNDNSNNMKQIRNQKNNEDSGKKVNEKGSKRFRRVLTVPSFISEKSHKSTRFGQSQLIGNKCRYGSACRLVHHQVSFHSNGFERSDESWTNFPIGKSRFSKETEFMDIACGANAFLASSFSERSFPHRRGDPSYASVIKKQRFLNRKKGAKYKGQDSCGVVHSNCEGDSGHQTSKKPILKKRRRKNTKKEESEKDVIVSWLKTENILTNKKLTKKLMLNGRKIDIDKLRDEFIFDASIPKSGSNSDSSLSSYKTVYSQSLFDDDNGTQLDRESDSTNETNKKSAIHTFIGPSAIDGMMNIINLFYARQKLNECSSFQD